MLALTASLIDSLSAMTEIFSKEEVIARCCGHASEAYPLLVGSSCYYCWKPCSQFFSLHLTGSVELEKVYILL